ncbi:hypothetical protein Nepgr_002657 [Nepenthes gracilis]|uniref:Uncharacterized protein n=1 Tax=Nepenthes gracilis TaxID=150966 RepID=A0AAD3P929_NEPGR|nr:hypothetical protein Nepgr_002657 [Nepenthes gracilis]
MAAASHPPIQRQQKTLAAAAKVAPSKNRAEVQTRQQNGTVHQGQNPITVAISMQIGTSHEQQQQDGIADPAVSKHISSRANLHQQMALASKSGALHQRAATGCISSFFTSSVWSTGTKRHSSYTPTSKINSEMKQEPNPIPQRKATAATEPNSLSERPSCGDGAEEFEAALVVVLLKQQYFQHTAEVCCAVDYRIYG